MKALALLVLAVLPLQAQQPGIQTQRATEVTEHIRTTFWNKKTELYAGHVGKPDPDFIWGGGVMFSALAGGARHDKKYEAAMRKYFDALEGYWDDKVKIPGYEPSLTSGGGSDKYYDDNAWMVLTFLEAHEITGESRYLKRASETLDFVLSGWDEQAGGGIWWHEKHKDDSKNTCINAPAAVGCFRMSKFNPRNSAKLVDQGTRIVEWTNKTLQAPNGLFADHIKVATGKINTDQLTYNAALMLRANLCLHGITGDEKYLNEAKHIGKAAGTLLDRNTGAYRDAIKWSHLMVEADLELHRKTGEAYLLERATRNAEVHYAEWKSKPWPDLIANASLARELWLLADRETAAGREFWEKSDRLKK